MSRFEWLSWTFVIAGKEYNQFLSSKAVKWHCFQLDKAALSAAAFWMAVGNFWISVPVISCNDRASLIQAIAWRRRRGRRWRSIISPDARYLLHDTTGYDRWSRRGGSSCCGRTFETPGMVVVATANRFRNFRAAIVGTKRWRTRSEMSTATSTWLCINEARWLIISHWRVHRNAFPIDVVIITIANRSPFGCTSNFFDLGKWPKRTRSLVIKYKIQNIIKMFIFHPKVSTFSYQNIILWLGRQFLLYSILRCWIRP